MPNTPEQNVPQPAPKKGLSIFAVIAIVVIVALIVSAVVGCIVYFLVSKKTEKGVKTTTTPTPTSTVTVSEKTTKKSVSEITDSDMAASLLGEIDIEYASNKLGKLRSGLVEFNDHLMPDEDAPYKTFVARLTYERASGNPYLTNAITMFESAEQAKQGIIGYAKDAKKLTLNTTIGDSSIAYYTSSENKFNEPASVTVRFTLGSLGGKVQVYDLTESVTSVQLAEDRLLPIAKSLAESQKTRVGYLFDGSLSFASQGTNEAITKLPSQITGATLIGTSKVLYSEWLGTTRSFKANTIEGFMSGGLRRFKLNSKSDEVVEVVIMQFDSNERAKDYQKTLLTSGVAIEEPSAKELTLPNSIADEADALAQDAMIELQSAQGVFLVDISVFSPFEEIDRDVASQDLIKISEEVLENF